MNKEQFARVRRQLRDNWSEMVPMDKRELELLIEEIIWLKSIYEHCKPWSVDSSRFLTSLELFAHKSGKAV
jgi:hypothetical protein